MSASRSRTRNACAPPVSPLELGGHHASTFSAADLVVLSPGVPSQLPAVEAARRAGVPVTGELELASRWLRGRIVAITGTKGKSTTTTLTGRMLEAGGYRVLVGGNIGLALSAQVEASTDETIHVIEASSFQLESAQTFRPWIAVLLNFSPDHLDRHATVEEYAGSEGAHLCQAAADGLGRAQRRRSRHTRARRGHARAPAAVLDERGGAARAWCSRTMRLCGGRRAAKSRSYRWRR